MKIFLLIGLTIGLVSTEKLDRTYLPPPGSKLSGGSTGDIQVPLEYPKETYLTGQSEPDGIPEIELGINRRPKPVGNAQSPTRRPGLSKFQNSYPQTTTSYAITQTTTFAPVDDYEGLIEGSGVLNATGAEQAGLYDYPQGQNYQQQLNQGQAGITPTYNQEQQSTLAPYGSTTQRPVFASNRKPEPYLPPVSNKGQTTGQNVFAQSNLGYPFGQPQGATYQDGQQFSTTYRPLVNQPVITLPANQHNQFFDSVNIPSSTAAPQYQGGRFGAAHRPNINQQRFGSTTTQQNLNQFPGNQNFATSTVGPQHQDQTPGSVEQNQYVHNQNIASTVAPLYQNGQRTHPEYNLQNQYISSTTPSQYRDSQKILPSGLGQQRYQQIVPSSTAAPQNQNGQQFTTLGAVPHSQYLGNQVVSSTPEALEYQGNQLSAKPGTPQETISSNQRLFGSRLPSQQNPKYPERKIVPSSTTAPQFQNGQQFVTSGADKPIQISGNQNVPSTAAPQNQDGQRVFRPGTSQNMFDPTQGAFGSQVPSQQNQNQYRGNGNFPLTSAAPQFTDSVQFTTPVSIQQRPVQQNQYQLQGQQNYPSSTSASEYQIPQYQFNSPESVQRDQDTPGSSQSQNGQQFITPGGQVRYDPGLPDQQVSGPSGNQQFSSAPEYQSTFATTPGSKQPGLTDVNQYPAQPNYNRFPSSTNAPQQFVTETSPISQHKNHVQNVLDTLPASQQGTGLQGHGPSISPHYKDAEQTKFSPLPTGNYAAAVSGFVAQDRPERPQAAFDRTAEILNYDNILTPEGYSYSYDTSNGIHADETGAVGNGTRAQGGYSYTGDDGKIYSVFYSADENGFQPRGDHLPTPPPIPEAIQRVIEQANKDMESGISDDGSYNEEKYGHKKYDVSRKQLKPKNKIVSSITGVDIPYRFENKLGTQNKKQFTPIGGKQGFRDDDTMDNNEEDHFDYENLDDDKETIEEKELNSQRVPNMRPTKVKNLTVEDNGRKYNNQNNFNERPELDTDNDGDITEDVSITNISADDDDLDESQDLDDKSDLINYDPNFRTDFHGTNKYLPKPKEANKFEQSKRRRPMMPRDNVKTTAKGVSKSGRPSNHKPVSSQNLAFEYEQDFNDDRVQPSRKNKITQKVKQQSKFGQQDTDNGDELNSYYDVNTSKDYKSGDDKKSPKATRPNKERNQYGNRRINKPVKSKNGSKEPQSQNENADSVIDEEKGYEYTPPQNKFNSGEAVEFPTRTSITEKHISPKGSHTTLRPFMTPNVYGDDNDESTDDDMAGITHGKPLSPMRPYYSYDASPDESERFVENNKTIGAYGITPSRLQSRVKSTSRPQLEELDNTHTKIENSRRPGNKIVFGDNTRNAGASTVNDAFLSTTPLPPLISNVNNDYQQQYQTSNKPNDDSSRFYEKNTQEKDVRRPAPATYDKFSTHSQGQVPSTTYRPNYFFGDRTLVPTGMVTVDGFGRPISSTAPDVNSGLASKQPGTIEEAFRPTVGRFGVTIPTQATSGVYQGSTSAPGEDFSGPKQPQRFDHETGYYY